MKMILDYVYDHEVNRANQVYLTQPIGGGKTVDWTWAQTVEQARRMAAYLKAQGYGSGDRIAMLSKNCAHFFMAELAIWMAGCTTVAIFPTESADTIRYVLEHSESKLLFVGKLDHWDSQKAGVPDGLPCIALPLAAPDSACGQWDAVVAQTAPLLGRMTRKGQDIAILLYTSGSTGTPKGVMHSFERISQSTEKVIVEMRRYLDGIEINRMLSYLPLAHVFERAWVQCMSMVDGRTHIFFTESLDSFMRDLKRARPTIFISVPRLWFKFQQGVFEKLSPVLLHCLLYVPIVGGMIRRKVLSQLGLDQVRLAGSGSAPISARLLVWYRQLGLKLIEGYGMSEDFAYSHYSRPDRCAPGYVGVPLPDVQVRLSEEGEILIRSPGQLVGYYKRPDLDEKVFTEDGFFRTGDRGEHNADGLLKITGRVKELFKTSKGEYVAPAPIENQLNAHPMIEMCMVSGSGQPAAYALVVLSEALRPQCGDKSFRQQVDTELNVLLEQVNSGLSHYEKLQMIVITAEVWTVENGYLTPTMKIKRSSIESAVAGKLRGWYRNPAKVQWVVS